MIKAIIRTMLGLLSITIGSAIIIWVLYNELIEKQPQYKRNHIIGAFGPGPIMISTGLYWLKQARDYFRRNRTAELTTNKTAGIQAKPTENNGNSQI